jgi:glycosyltransferase involved in cell wall biosynthesis
VAGAVHRLLSDPELRQRLVSGGRALAARHSWDRTAALAREVLERAAGR